MAAVHPSRAHMVPASSSRDAPNDSYREDKRYRPRHGEDEDRQRSSRREDHRDDGDRRDRDRQNSRRDDEDRVRGRPRSRSRSRSRSPDRGDESHHDRDRRASPSYDEYKRPATPPPKPNMYGPRTGRLPDSSSGHGWSDGMGGGGGGGDWMEHRRKQREASKLSIWPPSPKAPARDDSPSRHHKSSKKTKRSRSSDSDVSTDSEADRRRRKKSSRSDKHRSSRHRSYKGGSSKKSHRRRSSDDDDSASDVEDLDKKRPSSKGKDKDKNRRDRRSRTLSPPSRRSEARSNESMERKVDKLDVRDDEEEYWVEACAAAGPDGAVAPTVEDETVAPMSGAQMDMDDDEEIGPAPLRQADGKIDERAYGGALLRGEGSAMAAFVQDGQRIPRRGEIGLTSDQIDAYEKVGYVMSGSRHRRMNAVRMRKENQVISAEEKRGILKMQKEEKTKREALIVGGFKEIVEERLKGSGQK